MASVSLGWYHNTIEAGEFVRQFTMKVTIGAGGVCSSGYKPCSTEAARGGGACVLDTDIQKIFNGRHVKNARLASTSGFVLEVYWLLTAEAKYIV